MGLGFAAQAASGRRNLPASVNDALKGVPWSKIQGAYSSWRSRFMPVAVIRTRFIVTVGRIERCQCRGFACETKLRAGNCVKARVGGTSVAQSAVSGNMNTI